MSTTDLARFAAVARDPSAYCALSEADRRALGEALRDRFFALSAAEGTARQDRAFEALVSAVDPEPPWQLDALAVSYHPTARFKALRFVDAERLDEASRSLFARPCREAPELAAVFVDSEELSFRTFENIVPLDRVLAGAPLELSLAHRKKLGRKETQAYTFELEAPEATRAALSRLDELGLYVPPLNAVARGGQRFVFHSAALADALTEAVRAALPKALLGGFTHVNPVFRCNRFEPADRKFRSHHDTPYYDAARRQVSRYTVLVYLTGGEGTPALRVGDDVSLARIAPFTCVVFDQAYEHEGQPFADGRKVFLRTELVFESGDVAHEPGIAALFAKATYFTGESVFAPELAEWTDRCYERAAAAHFGGAARPEAEEPFVHKDFRGLHYVANGWDFWFAKGAAPLEACAAVALLDTLNAKVGGKAFRKLCRAEVVKGRPDGEGWIPELLAAHPSPEAEPVFASLDKAALFPEPEARGGSCCPFHSMGAPWDASRCDDILEYYERAQRFARARVEPAPIVVLGQEVFLDRSRFVVRPGSIHVLSDRQLEPVNFAACWNFGGSPENYVDVEAKLQLLQPLVPPILWSEHGGCWRLRFDFFRNSWMVTDRSYAVPVPVVSDVDPGEAEESGETPWSDAIDKKSLQGVKGDRVKGPWWAEDSPEIRELYADDEDEDEDD